MAYGTVIRKHNGVVNTPNVGVVMDLSTGIEYQFYRPVPDTIPMGKLPKWNVGPYDLVSFDIEGTLATNVTLVKKHKKGKSFIYLGS